MTAGEGSELPTNVTALVEAIDRRARQAGTEGATNVLRGVVGTITEVLGGLEDRLDRIETSAADARTADANDLRASLTGLHDRLGRLEEAFVQAVESSTQGADLLGEIRTVVETAIDHIPPQPPPPAPPTPPPLPPPEVTVVVGPEVSQALADIVARIGALEASVEERLTEFAATARDAATRDDGQILAGVANVANRVDAVEARIERAARVRDETDTDRATHALSAVQAEVARLAARVSEADRDARPLAAIAELRETWEAAFDRLDRAVGAVRTAVEDDAARTDHPEIGKQLDEVRASLERLGRNDSAGRVVGLIEARLSTGLDAMVSRADRAVDASDGVAATLTATTGRVAELSDSVDHLAAAVESLGARVERETATAIEAIGAKILDRFGVVADRQSRDVAIANDELRSRLAKLAAALDERETATANAVETTGAGILARFGVVADQQSRDIAAANDELRDRLAKLAESLDEHVQGRSAGDDAVRALTESVRRESEMLTQRVAAVAQAVEALRTTLDEHVRQTENSFGRRAGEVGRRLAVDFGLRPKKNADAGARELGPGGS